MAVASFVAGTILVVVTLHFGGEGQIQLMAAAILGLLVLGVLLGLRPWARD